VIDHKAAARLLNEHNQCVPVFPHNAIKSGTIFEVVKARGGAPPGRISIRRDLVNGRRDTAAPEIYTPEITNGGGFDATVSVVCTAENDEKKVAAILNEIQGRNHDGSRGRGVPTVFGMNFQAVSVGQKVAKDNSDGSCNDSVLAGLSGKAGGYLDGAGTPSEVLAYGLRKTDEALGDMIAELKRQGLYESTLLTVSAKHGQSPINPVKVNKPGHFADLVAARDRAQARRRKPSPAHQPAPRARAVSLWTTILR
jgi:hypothetical protein